MRILEYRGELYSLAELVHMSGIARSTLEGRLAAGWSVDRTMETPVNTKHRPTRRRTAKNDV